MSPFLAFENNDIYWKKIAHVQKTALFHLDPGMFQDFLKKGL